MVRLLVAGVLALALPLTALAAAVVESLSGRAQVGDAPLTLGQKVVAPTIISTGPGAQVFLRFDDGMQIVLSENSSLRVVDFRSASSGVTDRAVFELQRGAARVVTGKIALNTPKQFFFRTPQTQLTVERPADFTVALVNPAYITVNSGTVLSSNGWGVASLGAGSTTAIASNAAAPANMAASALPPSASSSLARLSLAQVGPPAGGAASGMNLAALGGAAQSTSQWVILGVVVAGVVALVAANQDDSAPTPAATPSHH